MDRLGPILENLAKAQRALLSAADQISSEQWKTPMREGAWSGAEVVAHLVAVERLVLGAADRITQRDPKKLSFWRKLRLPPRIVERRFPRVKSPVVVDPELLGNKEETLAELRAIRGRTLAFLDETKGRDLGDYRWKHPLLGWLNTYEWFEFLAAHEIRHSKQMNEIATALPKSVETLQK